MARKVFISSNMSVDEKLIEVAEQGPMAALMWPWILTVTWPEAGRTVAVDPSVIPLNSRLYITCESRPEVNGTYIAEDTGGLIKGNKIDIYMRDEQQARQWGRRTVKVEVVSE